MNNPESVRSVMIPVGDGFILLPSAMVAEVLRVQESKVAQSTKKHLQGILHWRHQQVPLLSLEKLSGLPPVESNEEPRIVVLYGIQEKIPFFAISTVAAPRILSITADMLKDPQKLENLPGLSATVSLDEQTLYLPDLQHLKNLLEAA